ncbi:Vomp family autotransporter [Bartonella taylorii]|uniref:Vomp family autotransporter n=1 Tax=Bartonella taylorii TaxID=33046 RepID=UPI001ABAE8E9|nr:Vomp family autotransporter [Bartonella taylorii]
MKKLYSKSSLVRTVTLGAAVATLLSSVSPVFAANLSITGELNRSTNGTNVLYPWGSHGSIVFAGDDNYCGVDNVVGRGGKQQQGIPDTSRITAETQYNRFINNQEFNNGTHPYGTTTRQEFWGADGFTGPPATPTTGSGYMGAASTGGFSGAQPEAFGIYSFATGCGSAATGNYSTVFGAGATAKAGGAQAFGVSALASGRASVAIGVDSEASGLSTVAIGGLATALGKNSVAMGTKARAEKNYAIAIGSEAEAQASGSIAIGSRDSDRTPEANRKVIAKAENAIAIGTHTYAEAEDSVAIGVNAQATVYDGVAIGGGSLSDREKGTVGYDPFLNTSSTDDGIAWKSTAGAFSVGEVGGRDNGKLTRQITGVAAGSQDTDAVNVAQLRAMRDVIAGGGGWKISVDDKDSTDVTSGSTVDFSVTYKKEAGKDNLKIEKQNGDDKQKVKFSLSDTLKLTSVTTGQASMSDDGFIIEKGPAITIDGIDAGKQKITNVADGKSDTDAVNYKQLQEVKEGFKTSWQLSVNGKDATHIGPNGAVNLQSAGKENNPNIRITKDNDHTVEFALADDINVMSVTAGESIMDAAGFRFKGGDGPSITVKGMHAGNQTIKGVAAGEADTDAVNYKQLKDFTEGIETGWKLSVDGNNATYVHAGTTVDLVAGENEGGNKNIKIEKDNNKVGFIDHKVTFSLNDNLKLTSVTTGDIIMDGEGIRFVDGGPSITANGIDAGDTKITKVKAGTEATDAVNYKQLQDFTAGMETGWKLSVNGKDATNVKAGSTVDFVAAKQDEDIDNDLTNIKIVKGEDNKVSFDLSEYIKVGRLETGDSRMSNAGFMIKDGPNMTKGGINAARTKIVGVADGTNENDAVNLSQLHKIKDEIEDNSLVKWDEGQKLITIGAEKGGIEINIANNEDRERVISGVASGKISNDSTEAINGSQLLSIADIVSQYFGGEGTDIYNGIRPNYTIQEKTANNVFDAFKNVNSSITDIYSQINNVAENSLVKWNEDEKLITIGKEKGGTKIDITGTEGERTIAGVKNGTISEDSTDAINGSQINKISGDVAKFFGGNAAFQDGAFVGPRYNLSTVSADGNVVQKTFEDVGTALEGLDVNIKNVNNHIQYVDNKFDEKFDNFSQDALLWSEKEQAFVALHEKDGRKTESKITYLLGGDISEDSTDAINGSQLDYMGKRIARYFGGRARYENGHFSDPVFEIARIDGDGTVKNNYYTNVADALIGMGSSIENVNNHIQNVDNKFDKFSQDALLWSEKEKAFVALHGPNGEKTESKITYLLNGDITEDSTDAINGSQLYNMGDKIANYFGGGANVLNGKAPTYIIQGNRHNDVGSAFEDVNTSITDIYSQINNVTENSLVKQEGNDGIITIGKATGGTKISIANKNNEDRVLSGVKDGELSQTSTEAVNGSQLFKANENLTTVTNNLKTVAENTSKYFGGSTDVLAGIEPTFLIQGETYRNVFDAFTGVNTSINNIDNKIIEMKENNLVQQDKGTNIITIGAKTAGTEINIAGYASVARSISGVKAAEKGDEAVNKDQLDKSIEKISKDIETASAAAVLYDKDANGGINYNSVTLGGGKTDGQVALLNVKDGRIAEESHDAINGSQINKISGDIANYFGGGASFENGVFKGPKYSISTIVEDGQVAKTNYYNVGDALTGLDANVKSVNNRLTNVSNEFNQKIEGISKDALLWDDEEQAFVARHEKDGQKTKSKLKYLLDGDISEGSTDAITGNQLYFMSTQLANYFGGGAKYENGQWTAPNFVISQVNADGTVSEKTHHNVADAFGGVNSGMLNINNRIDEIKNNIDSDVLHWNKEKGAYDANHDGQQSKIINVADGTIAEGSKDAVNGGQLWQTNERITDVEKNVKHIENRVDNISTTVTNIGETVHNIDIKVDKIDNKVNDLVDGVVLYDRDANGKKVSKVTLVGGNESEPVTIDNVANGKIETGSKEAVNGGQLHDYTQEQMKIVLDESKIYTDSRINSIKIDAIDEAVERANNYTNMKFEALNYSIENVRKEAKQAAAIGLAVSNLRYNDTPGKLSVAFGSGLWRGQSAFALGAGYSSKDGKIRSNLSATSSAGHWGVGLGLNLTLN